MLYLLRYISDDINVDHHMTLIQWPWMFTNMFLFSAEGVEDLFAPKLLTQFARSVTLSPQYAKGHNFVTAYCTKNSTFQVGMLLSFQENRNWSEKNTLCCLNIFKAIWPILTIFIVKERRPVKTSKWDVHKVTAIKRHDRIKFYETNT